MEFGLGGGNIPKFEEEQLKPLTIGSVFSNKLKISGQSTVNKNTNGLVNNANNFQDSQMSLQKFYNYYMNRIKN